MNTVITGTGSYIPERVVTNNDFIEQDFFAEDKLQIKQDKKVVIDKFEAITGIKERRYADNGMNASDLATIAAERAIVNSQIDREALDLIIVAHNFGDVSHGNRQADTVPALASRVKYALGIKNASCIAFDVLFGCPGWLMALMQADAFFKAGMSRSALIIGAETLSRVYDPFDRDSMIFSDGAGAAVLEYIQTEGGVLASNALSHCQEELGYLQMAPGNHPEACSQTLQLKMKGRKVYEYALKHVPLAMKACVDKSGVAITDIKKVFIHQANEKMDEAILDAFFRLYNMEAPENSMPMNIHDLGNSSVATIPTLYDMVVHDYYQQHKLENGDVVLFASVGAGMNINAVCYRYVK
ncbi:3-oxoacyl-[acyl-carrier-protein] synthase-3 [Filimonas lacunae]|uniref:3-oxoacyl-[acyl-carrier-protein] synthase-3 n=1 Tax=Filimonas lacunae TaxID=477680 RepID=A0A173MDE8_9BACT|nr:ketoacyl-ACP synthase III [Filimonas lacunae]BAV05526.1 3-oxoacyl-[acyl-carrier-protein] synthase, KASIII [Filimonas lacunae]SIT20559.1 3-oxoacyl-[acyl-carrier-protein] synthase-3 [Filimonas lacunae]